MVTKGLGFPRIRVRSLSRFRSEYADDFTWESAGVDPGAGKDPLGCGPSRECFVGRQCLTRSTGRPRDGTSAVVQLAKYEILPIDASTARLA